MLTTLIDAGIGFTHDFMGSMIIALVLLVGAPVVSFITFLCELLVIDKINQTSFVVQVEYLETDSDEDNEEDDPLTAKSSINLLYYSANS